MASVDWQQLQRLLGESRDPLAVDCASALRTTGQVDTYELTRDVAIGLVQHQVERATALDVEIDPAAIDRAKSSLQARDVEWLTVAMIRGDEAQFAVFLPRDLASIVACCPVPHVVYPILETVEDGDPLFVEHPVDDISPVAIAQARYGGGYEGGKWLAFPLEPWAIPVGAFGEDGGPVEAWWENGAALPVGRGGTPDQAVHDLRRRLAQVEPDEHRPPTHPYGTFVRLISTRWPDGEVSSVIWSWRGPMTGPDFVET